MPQVDLVSVCAGGVAAASHNDRKVACESLAEDDPPASAYYPSDSPPESFVLSKDAEADWIGHNVFIERKNSGRSSSLHSANLNPNQNPTSISGSQRYSQSVKAKPSYLGLPKPQKAAYAEAKHRRPASIRLFPKRSTSSWTNSRGGKSVIQVSEPSSPKVSCIGRVRSRRDRGRRKKKRQNQPAEPTIKRARSIKNHKTGFWTSFRSIFWSKGHKFAKSDEPALEQAESLKKSRSVRKRDFSGLTSAAVCSSLSVTSQTEPPSLGAATRFSSGRRSDEWAAAMEVNEAKSAPLDRGKIWNRRTARDPPKEINIERDWGSLAGGPLTV